MTPQIGAHYQCRDSNTTAVILRHTIPNDSSDSEYRINWPFFGQLFRFGIDSGYQVWDYQGKYSPGDGPYDLMEIIDQDLGIET